MTRGQAREAAAKTMAVVLAEKPAPSRIYELDELLRLGGIDPDPGVVDRAEHSKFQRGVQAFTDTLRAGLLKALGRDLRAEGRCLYRVTAAAEVAPLEEERVYAVVEHASERFDAKLALVRQADVLATEDRQAAAESAKRVGLLAAAARRQRAKSSGSNAWRDDD